MKRLLHFLRLRYVALALLIWFVATTFDVRGLMQSPVLVRLNAIFADMGYPQATYDIKELTFSKLTLENIVLDFDPVTRDPISTIEKIAADYSLFGFFTGQMNNITIEHPDLLYSAEVFPHLPLFEARPFSLASLPVQSIEVKNLNLSYAGEVFNPSVEGSFLLTTDEDNLKRARVTLKGEQKDFKVDLKIAISEDHTGLQHIDIDFPELRADIPGTFMLSRGSGKLKMDYRPHTPLAAEGELMAGGMRVGKLPLDNISLVLSGKKPDLSVLGNATITGMPLTNISLRVAEDEKGAQALWQFSGESPQGLAKLLGSKWILPKQQKYSFVMDAKNKTISKLLAFPVTAGAFFYGDTNQPILKASIKCPSLNDGCTLDLPTTPLSLATLNTYLGAQLADLGLTLQQGDLRLGTKIKHIGSGKPTQVNFESSLRDATLNWQGLKMASASLNVTSKDGEDFTISSLQGQALGGIISSNQIDIKDKTAPSGGRIHLKNIALDELARLMRTKGLVMNGPASGQIAIAAKDGKFNLAPGSFIEGQKGAIRYTPKTWPSYLSGDDARLKTLRDVLKDYQFSTARVDFSGDPQGDLATSLSANGKSPGLFQERPLQVILKMDGPLAPGIVSLLP